MLLNITGQITWKSSIYKRRRGRTDGEKSQYFWVIIFLCAKPWARHMQYLIYCIRPGCKVPMSRLSAYDRSHSQRSRSHTVKLSQLRFQFGSERRDTRWRKWDRASKIGEVLEGVRAVRTASCWGPRAMLHFFLLRMVPKRKIHAHRVCACVCHTL